MSGCNHDKCLRDQCKTCCYCSAQLIEEAAPENSFGVELNRLFEEFGNAMQEGDFVKGSIAMNAMWVMYQIMATSISTDLKELTYLKTPFTFDNGGKYVMIFMHVDGPKIKLKESSGEGYTKKFEEIK